MLQHQVVSNASLKAKPKADVNFVLKPFDLFLLRCVQLDKKLTSRDFERNEEATVRTKLLLNSKKRFIRLSFA
jgi:hypothetical protein